MPEQLGAQNGGQAKAEDQRGESGGTAKFLADGMVDVHVQMAKPGDEVLQVGPDQRERHQFPEEAGHTQHADIEGVLESGE